MIIKRGDKPKQSEKKGGRRGGKKGRRSEDGMGWDGMKGRMVPSRPEMQKQREGEKKRAWTKAAH
jgi:hypothetical protein